MLTRNKIISVQNRAHGLVEGLLMRAPLESLDFGLAIGAFVLDMFDGEASLCRCDLNKEDAMILITNKDSRSASIIQACQGVVEEG